VSLPGTAVQWDGEFFEVVEAEEPEGRPARYVLEPWDDRNVLRSFVDYAAPSAAAVASGVPGAPPAAPTTGALGLLHKIPAPVRALAFGLVPVLLFRDTTLLFFLGNGPMTFVHELGHTVVSWVFGRFAVPVVVITYTAAQSTLAVLAIWGVVIFLGWRFREGFLRGAPPRLMATAVALALLAVVYPFVAFSDFHETLISVGGHGAEIAMAACVFFLAMQRERPDWARAVLAFYGWYLSTRDVAFFRSLSINRDARLDYESVSYTGGDNDLVKVAKAHGIPLETLAAWACVLAVLVPLAGLLVGLWRARSRSSAITS